MKKTYIFILILPVFLFTGKTVQAQMNFALPLENPFGMQRSFIREDGKESGFISRTSFIDIDNDGDLDCFGTTLEGIEYLENVGDAINPIFVHKRNPISKFGTVGKVCFADIDGDGDQDIINSQNNYLENAGGPDRPVFVERPLIFEKGFTYYLHFNEMVEELFTDFSQGVSMADIDGDGDLDLFFGGFYGNGVNKIYFARNVGTKTNHRFRAEDPNPFGLNNTLSESFLTFVDVDNDTDLHVVLRTGNMDFIWPSY